MNWNPIKRAAAFGAALLLALSAPAFGQEATEPQATTAPPNVGAQAYIVMDADTGQVLVEKNADEQRYPASITKIMTLALAVQKAQGDWSVPLTVSYDDVYSLGPHSSHIALQVGETVPLDDMLYGAEIASANDAADVLASYIGGDGTIQSGVDAMNAQVAALGLTNTHFVNPHGLQDKEHYTTARDMAEITRWALTVDGFQDVFCRNEMWLMGATDMQPKERYFYIDDWMRLSGQYYRSYAQGSKSGYTNQAQYTFVTYAEQDGIRLVCVLMGMPGKYDKFQYACDLLDYCYDNFQRVEVADGTELTCPLTDGNSQVGDVVLQSTGASVLLSKVFSAQDVSIRYEMPQEYQVGEEIRSTAVYSLPENTEQNPQLAEVELSVLGVTEKSIPAAATVEPTEATSKLLWARRLPLLAVGGAVLALSITLGWLIYHRRPTVRAYNSSRWTKRGGWRR